MNNNSKKNILLIDDDTSLLVTLSDFLSFEGYQVTTADCGEAGLECLKSLTPDLIILDMSMPGMGGVGFLKEISAETGKPKHPVLVLTARANMAEFFADMDVDGFVSKPCDPSDLLMEVGRIVFLRSGADQSTESDTKQTPCKILLAEDDPAINKSLIASLERAGYDVISVTQGPDVLEKAIINKPDVIVIKFVLTSMNGDAIAEVLYEMPNTKNIPIILYDDTNAQVPESKYVDAGTGIKKFVRDNSPASIIAAVSSVIK